MKKVGDDKVQDDIVINECSKESRINIMGKLLIPLLYIIVAIMFFYLLWKTYSTFV
ncbi:hypothetical protein CPJCM30710_22640 [Clostridium polyendosporum]|uniref:Uncharacterized protein n=1 Tax=Clostridium polyendosporum TaxID=69208 RepID=A0A919VMH7_9CLOT|nr:hypothetical protein [Clostridium polyendosporum]GIM29598.1 hypothetical protein CPJCM30710_22640 [Clostridium polyendosporum]